LVVEDFTFDTPKTKDFISLLKGLKIDSRKMLLVLPENNKPIFLSARNLPKANVITTSELNTFKVMDVVNLVFTEKSVGIIEQNLNA